MARRQDGVSAPETRAGRMATSARMTLGQESMASDAESYQRSPWRRPDPRPVATRFAPIAILAAALEPRHKLCPPQTADEDIDTLQVHKSVSVVAAGTMRRGSGVRKAAFRLTRLSLGTSLEPLPENSGRSAESHSKKALRDSDLLGGVCSQIRTSLEPEFA